MAPTKFSKTEWRVCCVALPGPALGWHVQVHVRALDEEQGTAGPWRLVRDVEYKAPMGQLRTTYWKDLLKAAAQ